MENPFARFDTFDKHLTTVGYLAMGGQIVDATIVAAPKQRNSDAEKVRHQGRKGAGRVAEEATQAAPEGPGRALDREALEGQGR